MNGQIAEVEQEPDNEAASVAVVDPVPTATAPIEQWNIRLYFPRNRYVLRLMGKEFKLSKKQLPMIEFDWEICGKTAPDGSVVTSIPIKQDDGTVIVAGISGLHVTGWQSLTENAMPKLKAFHKLMGLPVMDINPEAPELSIYDKLIINAIVSCEKRAEMSDDIDETTGAKLPILDDEGKPIIKYVLNLGDIISRNLKYVPTNPW